MRCSEQPKLNLLDRNGRQNCSRKFLGSLPQKFHRCGKLFCGDFAGFLRGSFSKDPLTPKTFIAWEQPSAHEPLNTTHEHSAVLFFYRGAVRCSEQSELDLLESNGRKNCSRKFLGSLPQKFHGKNDFHKADFDLPKNPSRRGVL